MDNAAALNEARLQRQRVLKLMNEARLQHLEAELKTTKRPPSQEKSSDNSIASQQQMQQQLLTDVS